jgi:hypothetical protein
MMILKHVMPRQKGSTISFTSVAAFSIAADQKSMLVHVAGKEKPAIMEESAIAPGRYSLVTDDWKEGLIDVVVSFNGDDVEIDVEYEG